MPQNLRSPSMGKPTSHTKEKRGFIDSLVGNKAHHETTIRGGGRQVTGRGNTSQESQRNASKRWGKNS